jgi:hypothetical protein
MRSRTLLTSFALLAIAGVAGAQGTTKKATPKPQTSASAVPTSAKLSTPADTAKHAVKKSSRRRHRNASKAAATDTSAAHAAAPAAKPKTSSKKS